MRRLAAALGLAGVTVLGAAGAGSASSERAASVYRVVGATSTAYLTYTGLSADRAERTSGTADASSRKAKAKRPVTVSVSSGGAGRAILKLSVKRSERSTIGQRPGPTQPYVENRCHSASAPTSSGGFVLRKLSGGRMEVRWAFPYAAFTGCPGPLRVGQRLAAKMARILPASRLATQRVTLSLSGSTRFRQGIYSGTYRWRASVTLSRV